MGSIGCSLTTCNCKFAIFSSLGLCQSHTSCTSSLSSNSPIRNLCRFSSVLVPVLAIPGKLLFFGFHHLTPLWNCTLALVPGGMQKHLETSHRQFGYDTKAHHLLSLAHNLHCLWIQSNYTQNFA
jgi:hypothetical protein